MVAQLKQLQSETEPIVKMFEDPETTRQMQSTRSDQSKNTCQLILTVYHIALRLIIKIIMKFNLFTLKNLSLFDLVSNQGWEDAL